jgi:hypothetical protein
VCALAAVLALPTPAMAAGWLSKTSARAKTVSVARSMWRDLDFATRYKVERAERCSRLSRSIVECDFRLYDDPNDIVCEDAVRVRRATYGLRVSFPYSTDCHSTRSTPPSYEPPSYSPPSYSPPSYSPPTTGNFGSGSGSVGLCNDGTLSDSIGRPGACSWHGGVAP